METPYEPAESNRPEDGFSDEIFREVFGVSRRQAQNLSDFADRRRESRQYEKLGRAVVKKVLYLGGTLGGAIWLLVSNKGGAIMAAIFK